MSLEIRRLRPDDDRSGFHSGDIDLDRFFHRFAGQNQFRHHIGTTYVAVEGSAIVGFATVTASELSAQELPVLSQKRLPQYPLPVLRLARLATDDRVRGRGIGSELLRATFVLAHTMANDFGCVGIVVDAKAHAIAFYERLGFVRLDLVAGHLGDRPQPTPMFLEIGAVPR